MIQQVSVSFPPLPGRWIDVAPQIDAACEGDWSADRLLELGERIWNMERQFNLAAGFTGADDTLPARLLKDAAKTGPAKGKVSGLETMLPEYYSLPWLVRQTGFQPQRLSENLACSSAA